MGVRCVGVPCRYFCWTCPGLVVVVDTGLVVVVEHALLRSSRALELQRGKEASVRTGKVRI